MQQRGDLPLDAEELEQRGALLQPLAPLLQARVLLGLLLLLLHVVLVRGRVRVRVSVRVRVEVEVEVEVGGRVGVRVRPF